MLWTLSIFFGSFYTKDFRKLGVFSFPLAVFIYLVFDWFTIRPAYRASFSSVRNISFKAFGVRAIITKSSAYAHMDSPCNENGEYKNYQTKNRIDAM